jgi:TPR repeat protein
LLIIRKAKIESLREMAMGAFREEMLVHLGEYSPRLSKGLGEASMREVVRVGIDRARGYGFSFRGPVRLYLELMLSFGSHFDTDPQYRWAGEILADADEGSQMERAEALYEKAVEYWEQVVGPDDAYLLAARKNMVSFVQHPLLFAWNDFVTSMLEGIAYVYPQKAAYIGNQALEALIREAIGCAERHRLPTDQGWSLIVALMLAFGHGCDKDLLCPWIAGALAAPVSTDPAVHLQHLKEQAVAWLDFMATRREPGRQA